MSDRSNTEQIEHHLDQLFKKWGNGSHSRRWVKKQKIRQERRRVRRNPECAVKYRKYYGYEY